MKRGTVTISVIKGLRGALILLTFLGFSGCGSQESETGNNIVKIGQVSPLTGSIAHLGKDNEYGARLAIMEANERNISIAGSVV